MRYDIIKVMETINQSLNFVSALLFIGISHHLLMTLFDWEKLIKVTPENIKKLRFLILLLSIALGYTVSQFILGVIYYSQLFFLRLN